MKEVFSGYQKIAESYGFLTEFNKEREELLIKLPGEKNQILHLRIDEEVFGFPLSSEKASLESFIHIYTLLEVPFNSNSVSDLSRLMNFINKSLEAPGFVLDEINSRVLYKTVFFKPNEKINENTFMCLLGLISLYIDTFTPLIERIAIGESLDEVLESELKSLV